MTTGFSSLIAGLGRGKLINNKLIIRIEY